MEILKDIEKKILNINIYDKNVNSGSQDPLNNVNMQKLDAIRKQINDYFKYKDDEKNIILQKKLKYDEDYRFARELNDNNYKIFLEKKAELHNIFKETKTLASLYEYLNYKYIDAKKVPDIYTYEYIKLNQHIIATQSNTSNIAINTDICAKGKILDPITKKCVKDPVKKVKEKKDVDVVKDKVVKDKVVKDKVVKDKVVKDKVVKDKVVKDKVVKDKVVKDKVVKDKVVKDKVVKDKVVKDKVVKDKVVKDKVVKDKKDKVVKDK
jgi:hypothetical protein